MRIIFLQLLLIQSFYVISQSHIIGIYGGTNFASARGDGSQHQSEVFPGAFFVDYQNSTYNSSPTFGFTYNFILKNNIVIGTDLTYIVRGFTSETIYTDSSGNPWNPSSVDFGFKHKSLSLPIKFGYTFGDKIFFIPKAVFRLFYLLDGVDNNDNKVNNEKLEYAIEGEIEVGFPIRENYLLSSLINFNKSLNSFQNPTTSNPKFQYVQFSLALKKRL